ncbi:MAG TPA: Gfo/Idh/MocA family oxidoreductase [Verrucomicrobiota bacterium]|nr:Gfo/Idh/MocA family oxidoreductase [Verrucomicrobiota bacterium]
MNNQFQNPSRRRFIKTVSVAAGAAVFGVPTLLRGANLNGKLNIATIGVMGKGKTDTDLCNSENIVALCDVDSKLCLEQREKYPSAKFYQDYRVMFEEMADGIDAVIVSTPDHFHAVAASLALKQGKHVYCQKPLTETVYESRHLRELARKTGLVTQMGNQGSASDGLRRAVECIQSGLIGQVHELHVWTNRPIWPQGIGRPAGEDPIPDTLNWDVWIGPAHMRPYKGEKVYHPFNWRGWLDFGTGALGDMGCHTLNMPFQALNLKDPAEIEPELVIGGMNTETYPIGSIVRFQFPARQAAGAAPVRTFQKAAERMMAGGGASLVPLTMWWYDGGHPVAGENGKHDSSNKPPSHLTEGIIEILGELPRSGCLMRGSKGQLFSPDDYGENFFVKLNGEAKFKHYKKHEAVEAIPQRIQFNAFQGSTDSRHHLEWIDAIKRNNPGLCRSNFEVGGQLTELILLGCVALRAGGKIQWDSARMRVANDPAAANIIKTDYRAGWNLA